LALTWREVSHVVRDRDAGTGDRGRNGSVQHRLGGDRRECGGGPNDRVAVASLFSSHAKDFQALRARRRRRFMHSSCRH
jgi:hypothetical protein